MEQRFYHPRYWHYWLLLAFLRLFALLPYRWGLACGRVLGKILYHTSDYRKKIVERNLELAFAQWDEHTRNTLLRKHFDNVGMGFFEIIMAWFYSDARLDRLIRPCIDDDAAQIFASSHGVLLLGVHTTTSELGMRLFSRHYRGSGMYRPLANEFFNAWFYQRRRSWSTHLLPFDQIRHLLKLLRDGESFWYAIDQDMGSHCRIFVPFFGVPAATLDTVPKLLQLGQARLLLGSVWRENGKYVIKISTVNENSDDPVVLMTAVYQQIEALIRQNPEQYYWLHRRFKTRPQGEAPLYPEKKRH